MKTFNRIDMMVVLLERLRVIGEIVGQDKLWIDGDVVTGRDRTLQCGISIDRSTYGTQWLQRTRYGQTRQLTCAMIDDLSREVRSNIDALSIRYRVTTNHSVLEELNRLKRMVVFAIGGIRNLARTYDGSPEIVNDLNLSIDRMLGQERASA